MAQGPKLGESHRLAQAFKHLNVKQLIRYKALRGGSFNVNAGKLEWWSLSRIRVKELTHHFRLFVERARTPIDAVVYIDCHHSEEFSDWFRPIVI